MKNIILLTALILIIPAPAYSIHTISGAEYYIDTDPGEGNGKPIVAGDENYDSSFETMNFEIDLPNLNVGRHFLHLRTKNENGAWGLSRKCLFMVTGPKTIESAEYYIDTDPGEGNCISMNPKDGNFDGEAECIELSGIDTSNLVSGIHHVFIRTRNSEGTWGERRKYAFEVSEPSIIEYAEYYIDSGSGPGDPILLNASDGAFNEIEEDIEANIDTTNMAVGTYTVSLLAKDSYLKWGKIDDITFEVREPADFISGRIYTTLAGYNQLDVRYATVALEGTDYTTTTDVNGYFMFQNVPDGSYTLTINASDFVSVTQQVTLTGENSVTLDLPLTIAGTGGIYTQAELDEAVSNEMKKYDPSRDGKVSLEEAIHALQIVSGIK